MPSFDYHAKYAEIPDEDLNEALDQHFGVFVLDYLYDLAGAPIPTLTLNNVEVYNFNYGYNYHTFIEIGGFAGVVNIVDCKFNRFYFPHGVISNSNNWADRQDVYQSSYLGSSCATIDPNKEYGVDICYGITISGSTFKNHNFL